MSKPPRARYRTTNWKSYNAALARQGSLQIWFDTGIQWLSPPAGKRRRQPVFSDAAIQACLTLKALFKLPLRQATGMVASLLEMAGVDWPVPDFSTLSRRQKTLLVEIPCQPSSGALHLLTGSTVIKAVGDGEWCARKHGPSKRRQWRKVHLGVDAEMRNRRPSVSSNTIAASGSVGAMGSAAGSGASSLTAGTNAASPRRQAARRQM